MQADAKDIFLSKHVAGGKKSRVIAESFRFYRMNAIRDIYFVGGFGTVAWIDTAAYAATPPDAIVMYHPHETIEMLSDRFGAALAERFAAPRGDGSGGEAATASVISIDAAGIDVRLRQGWDATVHRLAFPAKVTTPEAAAHAVEAALAPPRGSSARVP